MGGVADTGNALSSQLELAPSIATPLELPGWIEFNARRTGLTPIRYAAGPGRGGVMVRAVLFADSDGRVRFPGKPYVPFSMGSPGALASDHRDWVELVEPIVDDMRRRGVPNAMHLPPEVDDIRPWQWAGFVIGVDYTYYIDLPGEASAVGRDVRAKWAKAERAGLQVRRVTDVSDLDAVLACLKETERRGGFRWGLDAPRLALALDLVGPEHLRICLCSDGSGEPASVAINLHAPGTRAVGWLGGTRTAFLTSGATQLAQQASRIDLEEAGATGLDEAGASIRGVAAAKARWGGRLVASYHVRTHGLRTTARFLSGRKRSRRAATVMRNREPGPSIATPLELPGWIEFNARRTGLTPIRYAEGPGRAGVMVRAVLFADSDGHVRFPGKPYVPFSMGSPGALASDHRDWVELVEPIVDDMRRRGVPNALHLPPEVDDIRPWQWAGFVIGVDYTYYVDLPFERSAISKDVLGKVTKAEKAGLQVRRVTDVSDLEAVLACLKETERRGGFRWGLDVPRLAFALDLLGPEHLRICLCSDGSGEPASVAINLHAPGTRAVAWLGGTRTAFLSSGATQMVQQASRIDLEQAGASGLDEAGASIRSVAAAKARWGGRLVASYQVRTHGLRTTARFLSDWKRSWPRR